MRKWIVKLFLPFVLLFVLIGCSKSSDNTEKVNVYKMVSFSLTEKDSLITFSDSKVIKVFIDAFNNAKRVPGVVDVAEPEYKVELGDKKYFLWIRQESGTIMNLNDRNTVYTLSKSSVKTINEFF
ncbi:hypothetical protein QNH39_24535 [Neobacillus novalis]|uniref:YhfM-like domain-containing protein n=1 Tax=Neobacillus novalis TaxID=220687 RepID=A0AA95MPT1_9BACI|nr:hypothetical protein [Neobacillus novalis]WHY85735.1 hypothetical protein QNH39_24535 [Neobacillus novalis]